MPHRNEELLAVHPGRAGESEPTGEEETRCVPTSSFFLLCIYPCFYRCDDIVKTELEDQMDKMAAEAIKIRLTGSFQQSDMAKRAGEVRDVNKRIQGVNQRIFEITSKIQEEVSYFHDTLLE